MLIHCSFAESINFAKMLCAGNYTAASVDTVSNTACKIEGNIILFELYEPR